MVKKVLFFNKSIILGLFILGIFHFAYSMEFPETNGFRADSLPVITDSSTSAAPSTSASTTPRGRLVFTESRFEVGATPPSSSFDFSTFQSDSGSAFNSPVKKSADASPKRTSSHTSGSPIRPKKSKFFTTSAADDSSESSPEKSPKKSPSTQSPSRRSVVEDIFQINLNIFNRFMDYFIKNICELCDDTDSFALNLKIKNIRAIIGSDDLTKLVKYYLNARRPEDLTLKSLQQSYSSRMELEAASAFASDSYFQPNMEESDEEESAGVFDFEDPDFYTEFEAVLTVEDGAKNLFDIILASRYGIYLLGATIENFTDDLTGLPQLFELIKDIVVHKDKSRFSLVYKILNNKRLLQLMDSDVMKRRDKYREIFPLIISLIAENVRDGFLLSYDFKDMLLSAIKINKMCKKLKTDSIDLDAIVLFRDDHIFNLIYEGKRSDSEALRLAGGHFVQGVGSVVSSKDQAEKDRRIQVFHLTKLTCCDMCGIAYIRFGARLEPMAAASSSTSTACCSSCAYIPDSSSYELTKESTVFPDSIKPNFYRYVKCLFDVASEKINPQLELLKKDFDESQSKTICLFRHKATFFNEFSGDERYVSPEHAHDVYVAMVTFKEDDVDVIWTCYLLGVFILDFTDEIERSIDDDSSSKIEIAGMEFEKCEIKRKIFDVQQGSIRKHRDCSEYSTSYCFQSDGKTYNLIGLKNGVYLKIEKDVFIRIMNKYEREFKLKIAAARQEKKKASDVARREKKSAK